MCNDQYIVVVEARAAATTGTRAGSRIDIFIYKSRFDGRTMTKPRRLSRHQIIIHNNKTLWLLWRP